MGRRIYDRYIDFKTRRSEGTIEKEIRGNRMELDLQDEGVSRDLFIYGVREERGTQLFERELQRIGDCVDDPVVVEIGANIGYFALAELGALPEASLLAFEPVERNAALLERNLKLNGHDEAATVERAAVGPSCGQTEFELTTHSNLNKVRTETTADPVYDTGQTITVDMWSVDEYLRVNGIDPKSVVAARMDVEGYELEVLRGMERLLAAEGPLVLSLEVHPDRLDSSEVRALGEQLARNGFEPVACLTETITAYPYPERLMRDVDDPRDIPDEGPAYNLIVTKPAAEKRTPSNPIGGTASAE